MKKRILSTVFVAAVVIAAAGIFTQNKTEVALSDLVLENVEALAGCEEVLGSCWLYSNNYYCCDAGWTGCAPCD